MTVIVLVIGALATLTGLTGVLSPNAMKRLGNRFRSPAGMYSAIGIRLVVGALLMWAAPACRPDQPWVAWVVRLIGLAAFCVAVVLLLMGRARIEGLTDWIMGRPGHIRGTSLVALVVGIFLLYAGM